jgi:chondroitin AC lyase
MRNLRKLYLLIFILLCHVVVAQEQDLLRIKQNLRVVTLHYSDQSAGDVQLLSQKLNNGGFSDLDYQNNDAARWHWGIHWQRLTTLTIACKSDGKWFESQDLKDKIMAGVDYWFRLGTRPRNAWWELIGVPFEMGKVFILMEGELGNERLLKALPVMNLAVRKDMYYYHGPATGQNLLWEAFNHVYAAALAADHVGLKRAFAAAADEITITKAEGIQPDFSFHQHGAQSYAFGYGKAFSLSAAQLIFVANGTKYALPDEKIKLISAYLLDGQRWCSYRNMLEYTAMGREIARSESKIKSIELAAGLMAEVDRNRRDELKAFASQLLHSSNDVVIKGNRYFPRIDFMVQQGGDFMLSVKTVSKDIVSTETGNLENLKGYHLGRGTHFIVRRGDEYEGIFPLWDWEKIPGSLCEQTGKPLPVYDWTKGAQGNTGFVLGVSNGKTGCSTYDFNKDSIQAHRSWFFFEREMALLVSGLQFDRPNPVFQTINQTFAVGNTFVNNKMLSTENFISTKIKNVWHDSIAYIFESGDYKVVVNTEMRQGSWNVINRAESTNLIQNKLFTLGIDAGKSTKNGSFACVVIPNAGVKTKSGLRILRNTSIQQVVYNKTSQTLQFVAYAPCEILLPWSNMKLCVKNAGVGLIQKKGKQLDVVFSTSKTEEIHREFNIKQGLPTVSQSDKNSPDILFLYLTGDKPV